MGILALLVIIGCSLTKKINDGTTAFQQKQYAVAVDMLIDEISQYDGGDQYAQLAFMLGVSYKNLNDSKNSLHWFIEAAKQDYGEQAFWEMAYALKKNMRYDDAILSFQRLLRFSDRKNEIRIEIEKCRQAAKWAQSSQDNIWDIIALSINSSASDYAPTLWQGNQLVFTSDRKENDNQLTYLWTGNAFSDLYVTDINDLSARPMEGHINTDGNEGTATFSQAGDLVFFTRCTSDVGDSYCRIITASLFNNTWDQQKEAFPMKPKVNYRDPVLIENDSVLILVSDDPGGIGGSDLYVSFLMDDGLWSAPELMPPYLNTIGEERFPTWDGTYLYYSSDHFPGLGGLDIFKTRLREDNSWTRPQNLLQPFNSSEDDYGYVVVQNQYLPDNIDHMVFFTSTRGLFGNDDLYTAIQYKIHTDSTTSAETIVSRDTVQEDKTQFLRIAVTEPLYAIQDNPNSFVVGHRKLPGASVKVTGSDGTQTIVTDDNGVVLIKIDTTGLFDVIAGKKDYLNKRISKNISDQDFQNHPDGFVYEVSLEIQRIYEGIDITLDNIYYDFNESFIRDDAKPALDYLIAILQDNPSVKIVLSSHTDCRGEEDFNLDLSQRRAGAATTYIIEEGQIDPSRLSAIGYGKSQPEIDCQCPQCTEEEHQINRRTTFAIIR